VKTQQIIKDALNGSKLDLCANVNSFVNLHTFIMFIKGAE